MTRELNETNFELLKAGDTVITSEGEKTVAEIAKTESGIVLRFEGEPGYRSLKDEMQPICFDDGNDDLTVAMLTILTVVD